jgi:hypothetical protein
LAEGDRASEAFADPTFEPSPTLLNPIEVWRIRGQVKQPTANGFDQLSHPTAMMKSGVIQNHHLSWHQCGQQTGFEPRFKHHTITGPGNWKRSLPLVLTVSGNHVDTSGSTTRPQCLKPLAPLTPAVSIVVTFIHPGFIDIDALG